MQNYSHYMKSDSDSSHICQLQEWDQIRVQKELGSVNVNKHKASDGYCLSNKIGLNIGDGLNFVTCEQTFKWSKPDPDIFLHKKVTQCLKSYNHLTFYRLETTIFAISWVKIMSWNFRSCQTCTSSSSRAVDSLAAVGKTRGVNDTSILPGSLMGFPSASSSNI